MRFQESIELPANLVAWVQVQREEQYGCAFGQRRQPRNDLSREARQELVEGVDQHEVAIVRAPGDLVQHSIAVVLTRATWKVFLDHRQSRCPELRAVVRIQIVGEHPDSLDAGGFGYMPRDEATAVVTVLVEPCLRPPESAVRQCLYALGHGGGR